MDIEFGLRVPLGRPPFRRCRRAPSAPQVAPAAPRENRRDVRRSVLVLAGRLRGWRCWRSSLETVVMVVVVMEVVVVVDVVLAVVVVADVVEVVVVKAVVLFVVAS